MTTGVPRIAIGCFILIITKVGSVWRNHTFECFQSQISHEFESTDGWRLDCPPKRERVEGVVGVCASLLSPPKSINNLQTTCWTVGVNHDSHCTGKAAHSSIYPFKFFSKSIRNVKSRQTNGSSCRRRSTEIPPTPRRNPKSAH